MKRFHRGAAEFTHFASLPFIREDQKQSLSNLQKHIT